VHLHWSMVRIAFDAAHQIVALRCNHSSPPARGYT
jgi:hypothetical protein